MSVTPADARVFFHELGVACVLWAHDRVEARLHGDPVVERLLRRAGLRPPVSYPGDVVGGGPLLPRDHSPDPDDVAHAAALLAAEKPLPPEQRLWHQRMKTIRDLYGLEIYDRAVRGLVRPLARAVRLHDRDAPEIARQLAPRVRKAAARVRGAWRTAKVPGTSRSYATESQQLAALQRAHPADPAWRRSDSRHLDVMFGVLDAVVRETLRVCGRIARQPERAAADRQKEAFERNQKGRIAAELSDYLVARHEAVAGAPPRRRSWTHVVWFMEFFQVPLTRRDARGKRKEIEQAAREYRKARALTARGRKAQQ
jgi:hypothetical protein